MKKATAAMVAVVLICSAEDKSRVIHLDLCFRNRKKERRVTGMENEVGIILLVGYYS